MSTTQAMDALAIANRVHREGARQRDALIGATARVVVPALINPTDELASMTLNRLFTRSGRSRLGVIPKVGPTHLNLAFLELVDSYPVGRQWWHPKLRLRELNEEERRRLVRALVRRAPKEWR